MNYPNQFTIPQIKITKSKSAFTLVEVMVSFTLFMFLSMGVLAAITTLDKISRSQATYSSVHALVMQELEAIRSIDYTPPNSPYTVGKNTTTQKKSTSISASGDTYMVDVTLVTNYEMVSSGHLVTVVATYETQGRLVTIETTTLINDYSTTS